MDRRQLSGKVTPVHQCLWPEGAEAVRRSGMTWVESAAVAGVKSKKRWRHDWAGGLMVRELLASGLAGPGNRWVWSDIRRCARRTAHVGPAPTGMVRARRFAA